MGERDIAAPAARRSRPGFWLLAPGVLLVGLVVISIARPIEAPMSPRGVAHGLGAASLARDFDLRFEAADETRFRDLVVMRPTGVVLAGEHGSEVASFHGNVLAMAYVAPFVRTGGLRGALVAHFLALAVAMGLAARTLRQKLDSTWRILLVCLFGSVTIVFLMEPRPETLVLSAVVAAFALAFRGENPRFEELAEVYEDHSPTAGIRFSLRWLLVGGLLTFAALSHPVYLLLMVPAGVAVPSTARRAGISALALGGAAVVGLALGVLLLVDGVFPGGSHLALFNTSTGFPGLGGNWSDGAVVPTVMSSARPVLDLPLMGWNLVYLVAGRSIGLLPYFLPVVLLLALWEPRARRSTLVVTSAVIAVVTVIVWPFDFSGDAAGLGNAMLLPIFGALWLVPTRRCGPWAPAAILLIAGVVLWPTWLQTLGLWSGGTSPGATVTSFAQRWLPHETTRRPVGSEYAVQENLRVLAAGGGVSERGGRLFLTGGSWGSLVLASAQPLSSVHLAFDGQAGSEIDVAGGELGNTLFGADGGVGFEVRLDGESRRHRLWWSAEPQSLYDLGLRLPKAPRVPVAFRVEGNPHVDRP